MDFLTTPLFVAIAGAVSGALLTWLLPPLWKSPAQRRLEQVQKASYSKATHSPVFQNASGDQINYIVNYVASSTSANSHYIATGQGSPIVPDVQRWLQSGAAKEPRPITRFEGEVGISHSSASRAEVFYPAPFVRPPTLQITPEGGTVQYTVEQRADGFVVKANHYRAATDRGVILKWTADGELALS